MSPEGQTVDKELYVEILWRLQDAIRRKRPRKRPAPADLFLFPLPKTSKRFTDAEVVKQSAAIQFK